MKTIEFTTIPSNNNISIPSQYSNLNNSSVRVVILQDDNIDFISDIEQKHYEKTLSLLNNDDKSITSSNIFSL